MVSLQVLTTDDADRFKAVRLRALRDTPAAFAATYEREVALSDADWQVRIARWNSDASVTFLAIDGTLTLGIAAANLTDAGGRVAEVYSMWVAPECRKQGIGRMLLDSTLAWAQALGVERMRLEVSSDNAAASDFYRSRGFTFTGVCAPHPNVAGLLALEMTRDIPRL